MSVKIHVIDNLIKLVSLVTQLRRVRYRGSDLRQRYLFLCVVHDGVALVLRQLHLFCLLLRDRSLEMLCCRFYHTWAADIIL